MNLHQSVAIMIQVLRDDADEMDRRSPLNRSFVVKLRGYAAELELALIEDSVRRSHDTTASS